jgi:hypothetical protein
VEGVAAFCGFNSRIGSAAAHPAPEIPAQHRPFGEYTCVKSLLQVSPFGRSQTPKTGVCASPPQINRGPAHARNQARHAATQKARKQSAVGPARYVSADGSEVICETRAPPVFQRGSHSK